MAYVVADQLLQQGQQIAFLGLLDNWLHFSADRTITASEFEACIMNDVALSRSSQSVLKLLVELNTDPKFDLSADAQRN
ncbi:hypothetical protein P4S72_15580 [Vibrio sp. PP-XX7]